MNNRGTKERKSSWLNTIMRYYKKYEEIIRYLVVGGLTTLISFGTQAFCAEILRWHVTVNTIVAFIPAVTFAYFANKHAVFHSQTTGASDTTREAGSFFLMRVISLVVEAGLLTLLVTQWHVAELVAKIPVSIVIVLLNYVFSKLFIFRKPQPKNGLGEETGA